jgi:hypothetical protein
VLVSIGGQAYGSITEVSGLTKKTLFKQAPSTAAVDSAS